MRSFPWLRLAAQTRLCHERSVAGPLKLLTSSSGFFFAVWGLDPALPLVSSVP